MLDKLSTFVREKRGNMSLREFAKLCGNISHTQIDSIERGMDPRTNKPVRPTVDTLVKIARGTGVPVAYLAALAAGEDFNNAKKFDNDVQFVGPQKVDTLSEAETNILLKLRALNRKGNEKLSLYLDDLLENPSNVTNDNTVKNEDVS